MHKSTNSYKNERNFGFIFGIIFLLIGLYFIFFLDQIKIIFFALTIIFASISLLFPKFFFYPNKIWIGFGYDLGIITTPIFVSLIYAFVVIPTGLILKIFGKDILDRKINKEEITNWKKREILKTQLDKQY